MINHYYKIIKTIFLKNSSIDKIYLMFDKKSRMIEGVVSENGSDASKQIKELIIPTQICGKIVLGIDHNAFGGSKIKSLIIPENIKFIKRSAFRCCEDLEYISIADNIVEIGDQAFEFCRSLKNLVLPNKIKRIGYWAFSECISLKSVVISGGTNNIEDWAFSHCKNLEYVVIYPEGIENISRNIFKGCKKLKNIYIMSSLERLSLGFKRYEFLKWGAPLDTEIIYIWKND